MVSGNTYQKEDTTQPLRSDSCALLISDVDRLPRAYLTIYLGTPNFVVQHHYTVDQRLRPWWTSGNIDIHRYNLIDTLNDGIIVKHTTAGCAIAHRDNPLRVT